MLGNFLWFYLKENGGVSFVVVFFTSILNNYVVLSS